MANPKGWWVQPTLWLIFGLTLLALAAVGFIEGKFPRWDGALITILFWGMVMFLLVRWLWRRRNAAKSN